MIPVIGLIVAAYAIARLIQVPIEVWDKPQRWAALLVSVLAIPVIGFLAFSLVASDISSTDVRTDLTRPTVTPSAPAPSKGQSVLQINPSTLAAQFERDREAGERLYADERIRLRGTVADLGKNAQGATYVVMTPPNTEWTIQATFAASATGAATLQAGKEVDIECEVAGSRPRLVHLGECILH